MTDNVHQGHRARKRFGQNFLHDPHVIGRIVKAIAPKPTDVLVEIGPGLGMTASHGSKAFGRLSVMTQYYCQAIPVVEVGPGAFKPAPKVDSAVVRLLPYPIAERAKVDPAVLNRVCLEAFNQRRKTLRNGFSNFATAEQISALGIDPTIRPEQLPVSGFVKVAQWLAAQENQDV